MAANGTRDYDIMPVHEFSLSQHCFSFDSICVIFGLLGARLLLTSLGRAVFALRAERPGPRGYSGVGGRVRRRTAAIRLSGMSTPGHLLAAFHSLHFYLPPAGEVYDSHSE